MGLIQVVTSNNIERGLIPTNNMFDTVYNKGLLRANEKVITVKFYIYNIDTKENILYTQNDNCTIDDRFVYTGNAGIIWFKLCFPVSYIRNRNKENLYAGGQKSINTCQKIYKTIKTGEKIGEDINPMEMFIINRIDDCLEIYPLYCFSKNTYRILPQKYIDMVMAYYKKNVTVFSNNGKTKTDSLVVRNSKNWISFNEDIDLLTNGGWYILKNDSPIKEYYFGKAESMANRIKWQDGRIGHPQNNPRKIEPLFDAYNCWYFTFDRLKNEYQKINGDKSIEEVHTEVLNLIFGLMKNILEYVVVDMGAAISFDVIKCDNADSMNTSLSSEELLSQFFDSYFSMVTGNIVNLDDIDEAGKPHYVFNKYCTSWIKGIKKPESVAGIYIINDRHNYTVKMAVSLSEAVSRLETNSIYRYIYIDFSQMDRDFLNNRKESDIYAGFLYGVEGLVNDILRFIARDKGIRFVNDAFDSATNTAFENMLDESV